jgi:type I restriction enzyme, R subunit
VASLLEHRPEVPGDVFRDAKLLGFINKVAANLYRDPALNLFGVAEKVKSLINAHVSARDVDPKIPPTAITDAEFEKVLQAQGSSRARAAQMQHAARYHSGAHPSGSAQSGFLEKRGDAGIADQGAGA